MEVDIVDRLDTIISLAERCDGALKDRERARRHLRDICAEAWAARGALGSMYAEGYADGVSEAMERGAR